MIANPQHGQRVWVNHPIAGVRRVKIYGTAGKDGKVRVGIINAIGVEEGLTFSIYDLYTTKQAAKEAAGR